MKMVNVRIVWLIVFYLFSGLAFSKTNFVTISLPEYVTVDLPRNWVLISNNKRITLDTWVESTFDINKLKNVDSSLPFAANYYENGGTVGIINSRYYPDIEISQKDAKQATSADVLELDQELRKNMLSSMEKIGMAVTSWEGTEKRTINGLTAFITEYHRKSLKGSGIFRVRLVRVLAGSSSFTLTVSYLESQSLLLKNITDRIISSLKMRGYQ
tara:strand:- start:5970 stop:6611 length:642 start_codon:yes stop_codon:yes gene_type:complete